MIREKIYNYFVEEFIFLKNLLKEEGFYFDHTKLFITKKHNNVQEEDLEEKDIYKFINIVISMLEENKNLVIKLKQNESIKFIIIQFLNALFDTEEKVLLSYEVVYEH